MREMKRERVRRFRAYKEAPGFRPGPRARMTCLYIECEYTHVADSVDLSNVGRVLALNKKPPCHGEFKEHSFYHLESRRARHVTSGA